MTGFYSKTPPDGDMGSTCVLEEHRTAEAAARAASAVLEDGSEGWPEDVAAVEWGVLVPVARAQEYDREETPEGEFDYLCKYKLVAARDRFDMEAHLTRQREWSARTFGTTPRAAGIVAHIRKELLEIEAAPTDLSEWIDVAILAFDGAWRTGATPTEIIEALVAKQARNEARSWPPLSEQSEDKATEHDRSADGEMGGTLARWMAAFGEDAADAGGKNGRLCWYGTPSEAMALVRDLEATAGGCIGPQHLPLPPVPTGMFGYHCGVPLLCREQGGGFCWVEEAASVDEADKDGPTVAGSFANLTQATVGRISALVAALGATTEQERGCIDARPHIRCTPEVGIVLASPDGPILTIDPLDGGDCPTVNIGDVVQWYEAFRSLAHVDPRLAIPAVLLDQLRTTVAEPSIDAATIVASALRQLAQAAAEENEVRKVLLAAKGFENSTRTTLHLAEDVAARLQQTSAEMERQRARADRAGA